MIINGDTGLQEMKRCVSLDMDGDSGVSYAVAALTGPALARPEITGVASSGLRGV